MFHMIKNEPTIDLDALDALCPPTKRQVGGDHYTTLVIQPMEYSMCNKLNALQHTAIKYITRYPSKGTPIEDLFKARHCIDMLLEYAEE